MTRQLLSDRAGIKQAKRYAEELYDPSFKLEILRSPLIIPYENYAGFLLVTYAEEECNTRGAPLEEAGKSLLEASKYLQKSYDTDIKDLKKWNGDSSLRFLYDKAFERIGKNCASRTPPMLGLGICAKGHRTGERAIQLVLPVQLAS